MSVYARANGKSRPRRKDVRLCPSVSGILAALGEDLFSFTVLGTFAKGEASRGKLSGVSPEEGVFFEKEEAGACSGKIKLDTEGGKLDTEMW